MGDITGTCVYAMQKGKALYCKHEKHYGDVCFFMKWCAAKGKAMNTDSYIRCPIREGRY